MSSEFYKWAFIKHNPLTVGAALLFTFTSACSTYNYEHDNRAGQKPRHYATEWKPARHDKHFRKQNTNLWQIKEGRMRRYNPQEDVARFRKPQSNDLRAPQRVTRAVR